jgi:hypothetical protein
MREGGPIPAQLMMQPQPIGHVAPPADAGRAVAAPDAAGPLCSSSSDCSRCISSSLCATSPMSGRSQGSWCQQRHTSAHSLSLSRPGRGGRKPWETWGKAGEAGAEGAGGAKKSLIGGLDCG